jgi:outer membrane protein assembly factor BamD (BamD/ComL family)
MQKYFSFAAVFGPGRTISHRAAGVLTALFIILLTIAGCSSRVATQQYTFDKQLLAEADGKFREKNYPEALAKYGEIVKSFPHSLSARTALYRIGYINIYFDNNQADWAVALKAFKLFQTSYPDDPKINDVNTWIRILISMDSFASQYSETTTRLQKMKNTTIETNENVDQLGDELHRCQAEKDSLNVGKNALVQKIKELEATILKIEKAR